MRLKRLELQGFKSFADRTVLDFGGRQLTGIVGPNGCGKSNVVDAVRWVLGETRPTSMRGAGMTDVIFKGSASRPPMSICEVTLVLDNEGGELEDRPAEVAVTRRLYKSGDGEYLIDAAKVRLKDVRDMLFDTGLGSRGYSVLEQGRIDAILSANPVQRRAIFEEAAGISRYRQRRHETELRLKRVEQDTSRLDDVMGELRSRVRSLKIQAGKAERYVVAKEEWTTGRTRFLKHKTARLDAALAELQPRIEELETSLDDLRERRAECEAEVHAQEQERSQVVAELDRVSVASGELGGELSALDERKTGLEMRITSWRSSAKEEEERANALSEQVAARRDRMNELESELSALEEAFDAADEIAGGARDRARELGARYKEARKASEAQNEVVLSRLADRTAAQNAMRHLEGAQEPARARIERAKERFADIEAHLASVRGEVTAAGEHVRAAETALAESDGTCERIAGEASAAEAGLAETAERLREFELERAQHRARVESLLDREAELATLSDGTRGLLEAIDSGEGPCPPEGLLGILADHISIDLRLARALDAALGDKAQRIVAADAHVALDLLRWMKEHERGQVGLVVPRGIGAPDCPTPGDFALFARYGMAIEGRLCEVVSCAPEMKPLAEALLCDVVVVSDLDLALELVGREPGWRFVTPAGEMVDASGIVGGHKEIGSGAVGRRSSAADLEAKIDELDRRLEGLAEEAQAGEERLAELRRSEREAVDSREARRRELSDLEGSLRAASARLADREAALGEHEREVGTAQAEIARLEVELGEAEAARAAAEAAFTQENEALEGLERARHGLEEEREVLSKEESRAEVEVTRLRGERQAARRQGEDLTRRIQEDEGEIARSEGRARNYEANAVQGDEECRSIDEERASLSERRSALETELEALRERERGGAQAIREVRGKAEQVQRELDSAGDELGKTRLVSQRHELHREELEGRAMEELELAPADLRADFEPEEELAEDSALDTLEQTVTALREKLEKIGPVNVEAVHELEEVSERLDFLEGQAKDLSEARRSLNETIAKIDAETRRLFLETFDEVRGNFQRIFRQLFGGGKADVILDPEMDVLEAGIEIVARPPGREMLSIGLLSGGQRTMTALALLFGVFEARPSPFCILDEVDAALDDANIDRFLAMLEGFLDTSQFIVVTHNKGTMSACDSLFGVTMQTKGVSSFVAVELEDVEEFAPGETTGKARGDESDSPSDESGDTDESAAEEPIVELTPARPRQDGTIEGGEAKRVDEPDASSAPN